ncbi:RAMP superfamily CRISPR-associated protein [Nitrosovibrio sp. Nv17]|uniref:RAMP superfamily CRISPR-associated protein n=1 Tax=Nitrosovibrio sp. Nv17 TaxID=1855339 RepID=UPI000908D27A|nr:RAMP superfamily CRISPR-associated protein [Nitrosovibrio sp. Nv17]SFW22797.1 CRISPR/Cas system CSM-associated protein Csm3, group 7 of RAMP superfamily [Nitrosovibrio sp. Nv17]
MTAGLSDPGGVRPIVGRWTITGELVLETAAHFGSGVGDAADMVLVRDARTGWPLLPGTSIAGAVRSYLADVLGGYRSQEDPRVARLFGGTRGDDLGAQSSLIVFDALASSPSVVEIRDGVQIDASRGVAEEHKKFDLEVLPAGACFPLRFDLIISTRDQEAALLSLLVAALGGLSAGDVALGARRSRGLGAVRATKWRATRHDLSSRAGWLAWLLSEKLCSADPTAETNDITEACKRGFSGGVLPELPDQRRRVIVDADISLTSGLLIRSAPDAPDVPDAAHIQSAGRSVLPGTSMAGVLRARALRIARLVRDGKGDAEHWVDQIFGPRTQSDEADVAKLHASKLRVHESLIEDGIRTRPSRVRIDRFTQGVVPGALFDEEPEHGGRARLRLELCDPVPGELGLCLLALKDLLTGDIAVGGSSSVGRGVFAGTATLCLDDGRRVALDPARSADPIVDEAIGQFWSTAALGGEQ